MPGQYIAAPGAAPCPLYADIGGCRGYNAGGGRGHSGGVAGSFAKVLSLLLAARHHGGYGDLEELLGWVISLRSEPKPASRLSPSRRQLDHHA